MQGAYWISDEELWQGTTKAAEMPFEPSTVGQGKGGGPPSCCKLTGCRLIIGKRVSQLFEDSKILRGGHVGRAHWKKLQSVTSGFIALHKSAFPAVECQLCRQMSLCRQKAYFCCNAHAWEIPQQGHS